MTARGPTTQPTRHPAMLPDRKIPLGTGERHLHDCLQALALHGLAE